jgi:hypothetical protein
MQNACYIQLEGSTDWRQGSSRQNSDQEGDRTEVADRIQTTDTIENTAQNLRESGGYADSEK